MLLERERIVAVEVRIGGEQEDDFADAEVRERRSSQHFGEAQRVRRQRVPRVGRERRIEAGQLRQRIEIVAQQLEQLRAVPSVAARAAHSAGRDRGAGARPRTTSRPAAPTQSARMCVRSAPVAPGAGSVRWSISSQAELVPQHLERRELTDEVGIDRAAVEQLQDACRCPRSSTNE